MSNNHKFDVVIVGSGMVGMSLAYQLNKKFPKFKICILEKEFNVGMHSSGRNSGVLHAGIYYPPNTLKAKVCVEGANRLMNWIVENKIKILNCGKIIIPQRESLDPQLDVLMERGLKNGAEVEIINELQIKKIFPEANITSGRGLWSPNTSVVDPKEIMTVLKNQLEQRNVKFFFKAEIKKVDSLKSIVQLNISNEIKSKKCLIHYGHLFNCAGLQSDKVAKLYGVALKYKILPFKGLYWDLKSTAPFKINTNLYPVPDLSMPFLGIHATPTINGNGTFGPTAIPAFGIENYKTFENIEALNSVKFSRLV